MDIGNRAQKARKKAYKLRGVRIGGVVSLENFFEERLRDGDEEREAVASLSASDAAIRSAGFLTAGSARATSTQLGGRRARPEAERASGLPRLVERGLNIADRTRRRADRVASPRAGARLVSEHRALKQ